ncbi:MAG: deoxyguanosinetriphosphate triphosphohydrolase [Candidatus Competibacterales bacterium]
MDWPRLLSRARLGVAAPRPDSEVRTDFQRDFDRIVFSAAFRRLQDKTQVFPLARSDYARTRLTHTLEVSSVGRSLGTAVGDGIIRHHGLSKVSPHDVGAVVAAACLAHDIGNPPFGHAGEDAIRHWFAHSATGRQVIQALSPQQARDFLQFEGNAQGFRLLTRLQSPDNPGGMQLTCATLGAFAKYPRASTVPEVPPGVAFQKFGFCQDDAPSFQQVAEALGLLPAALGAWHRHPLAYLVEAADDICYRIIDIEDAFRLGLLPFDAVRDLLLPLAAAGREDRTTIEGRLAGIAHHREQIEFLRAKAIGCCIDEVAHAFFDCEEAILMGRQTRPLTAVMPSHAALQALRSQAEASVYTTSAVVEVGAAGFEVLGGLLQALAGAVFDAASHGRAASAKSRMLIHLLPPASRAIAGDDLYRRVLLITDFISGMTDSYAVDLYRKINGISLPRG